ncbi:tetratricopeptide repeat protein [Aquabacterium sp.]|uniref:tetratricopeptide repeat protein n=1 Tax=Aquabacterium sp. TaxID=1872578 RepID=UPI002C4CCB19|nr:tetratricopeptide repeat protein [Aquabacterium sp.]HSW06375.1 tetratricopeptide repeat protein [Aquabacterium sp.]
MTQNTSAGTAGRDVDELHRRIERLSGFLAQDNGNEMLRRDLFDALLAAKDFARAMATAEEALLAPPGGAGWIYRRAIAARLAGQPTEAVAALRGLAEGGVNEPSVIIELARAELDAGETGSAIDRLQQLDLTALEPTLAEQAAVVLLPALMGRGQLDQLIAVSQAFLTKHPQAARVMGILGSAYVDANRISDARALVQAARQHGISEPNLDAVAGFVALDAADIGTARRDFASSLRQAPGAGRAHLGMGLVEAYENRLDAARAAFERAVAAMPTHLGSWHALAWVNLLADDVDAAEQAFLQALDKDRNFGDTYGGLAVIAARRGDRNAAQEHIRTGKRLDRFSVNVGVAEAMLAQHGDLRDPGTLARAFEMFQERALARSPLMQASFARLMSKKLKNEPRH